ncbi:hypothetical protein [Amycolatopsis sp. SID8362]|uniref:hypothetical protein n=1 Tax=Amycolatopsis sp. SID8362 TaxID=2690346 RepID=UPI00136CD238|nr:hypothetical protein [Amycolatopsis sp. SID8362]NBH06099.1 hypothetical protein [Amycolatopsis sp. SID8362]NED42798.1 hypothetical protein [Amycolatopsis sp. SID8362]
MKSTTGSMWGLIVAAVLGLPACAVSSASPGPAQAEPDLGTLPTVTSYADISFPLDAYHPSPDDRASMARAGDVVLRDCMRRYGFDVPLPERTVQPEPAIRRIGLIDADAAARYGYKPPDFDEYSQRVADVKSKQFKWSPQMMAVLNGDGPARLNGADVPPGGCGAESSSRTAKAARGEPGDENFVIHLEREASAAAEKDSRLTTAFSRWSACMADAGFTYSDPWQANNDRAFADGKATPRMLATAKADVACRGREQVNSTWVAVITAYQKQAIAGHRDALDQHRQLTRTQVATAHRLLAG